MSGDASSVIGYDHGSVCVGSAKMVGYPGGMRMADAVSPLLVLQARAEARAILYAAGELGEQLEPAVVPLLKYAMDSGITDTIGAEGAYCIIKQAFAGVAEL
jgi:hypothetical protein